MIPRRLEHQIDLYAADTFDRGDGILHPSRHVARDRAARRGERHIDRHVTVIVNVDLVNETQLIDVDWDLGVVDRLQRGGDGSGQPIEFILALT
jgi:hypothetical protein